MILCFYYFLYWLAGVLLATALSLLATLVSAGGDRAVAVTTIAFQYFGMHVFFICVLNVYFIVCNVVHGWIRNDLIKMINRLTYYASLRGDEMRHSQLALLASYNAYFIENHHSIWKERLFA